MAKPLLVFDLDGTLVDSAPDLIACLNEMMRREGLAPVPLEHGRRYVGRGARIMLRRAFEANGASLGEARLEQLFAAFLAYYADHLADRTRFYPGVETTLDDLLAAGYGLAVCTNKLEAPAVSLLKALGGAHRFRLIAGQDTFPVCKPNAAALTLTIERAGGDPRHAVMVGDSETDVATAKNAELPVVAVDFGYSQAPVATLGADHVISRFDDLPAAIDALERRRTAA